MSNQGRFNSEKCKQNSRWPPPGRSMKSIEPWLPYSLLKVGLLALNGFPFWSSNSKLELLLHRASAVSWLVLEDGNLSLNDDLDVDRPALAQALINKIYVKNCRLYLNLLLECESTMTKKVDDSFCQIENLLKYGWLIFVIR